MLIGMSKAGEEREERVREMCVCVKEKMDSDRIRRTVNTNNDCFVFIEKGWGEKE